MDYVDVEKKAADADVSSDPSGHRTAAGVYTTEGGAVPGESFEYGNSLYARIQRLAGRFNIEQRGIERVPEDERTDHSLLNVGTMVMLPSLPYMSSWLMPPAVALRQHGR